jgi:hypothetical protein
MVPNSFTNPGGVVAVAVVAGAAGALIWAAPGKEAPHTRAKATARVTSRNGLQGIDTFQRGVGLKRPPT